MATWSESCPLDGTCTECGYQFQWRELLGPTLVLPRWCVESRQPLRSWPRQFIATAFRSWIPNLLWRRLQAFHIIQRHRLTAWLTTWMLVIVLVTLTCNGVLAIAIYNEHSTMRFGWGPGTAVKTTPNASFLECVLQSMFLPFKSTSMGGVAFPNGAFAGTLPSPRSLLQMQWRGPSVPLAPALLIVPACCALTFAALPVSRRRAKVRSIHILRAAIYGMALPFVPVCLLSLMCAFRILEQTSSGTVLASNLAAAIDGGLSGIAALLPWLVSASMLIFIPITFAFWHACVRYYLRMQHAAAVALSVTIIGLLAPIAMLGAMWVMFDFRLRF